MTEQYAIECRQITKAFGSVVANDKIDLTVRYGEIMALLGENGSGKTTLMNMLSGIYHPDAGSILVGGKEVSINSPVDSRNLGIGMIHQHFKLVEVFSAMDNIVLGTKGKRLGRKALREKIEALGQSFGLEIEPEKKVYDMSVSEKQTVEIVKVLYRGADILILDEPTAVLTPQETDELFAVIRRVVRELGMTVIIITHKLYEVMAISDRVGVMRKGRLIGVENTCDVDEKKLASMMVGRPVLYDRLEKTGEAGAEQIAVHDLTVCDDRGLVAVDGLSLSVRAGEVLGIAAIEGNGQSELLEAITGMRRVERGTLEVCGQNVTGKTAGEIRKVGLSHIPEDRLATGVSRSASVTDNLLMGKQRDKAFSGFAFHQRRSSIERYAEEVYERFDIRGAGNLLGAEQSGFIADIGFETYQKIMNEAIAELRAEGLQVAGLGAAEQDVVEQMHYVDDAHIEIEVEAGLPDAYVAQQAERLKLYRELDSTKDEAALQAFESRLADRFGPLPREAQELLNVVRLRWEAIRLGIERVKVKNGLMILHFVGEQNSPYYKSDTFMELLRKVTQNPARFVLKQHNNRLAMTVRNVKDIEDGYKTLQQL